MVSFFIQRVTKIISDEDKPKNIWLLHSLNSYNINIIHIYINSRGKILCDTDDICMIFLSNLACSSITHNDIPGSAWRMYVSSDYVVHSWSACITVELV